jgi:hypothetical protein
MEIIKRKRIRSMIRRRQKKTTKKQTELGVICYHHLRLRRVYTIVAVAFRAEV